MSIAFCSDHETNLINDLLRNYQKYSRPVSNPSSTLPLDTTLTLKQIIDLDERNQLFKTNLWLEYYWVDEKLTWKPEDYGNIRDIRIPLDKLWSPDILMYHSASEKFDSTYPVNIIVWENGKCKYGPPAIFQSTCEIDMTWFPFDEQECKLKFGSWTYHNASININISEGSNSSKAFENFKQQNDNMMNQTFEDWYIMTYGYEKNGEWELLDLPAERNVVSYYNNTEHYIDVTYIIKLRRRTLYYFSNLIVPCALIASISVLGFYFPPASGEKVSLEITILMSLTFFMQVVRDMQPPSSHIPLISTYFTFIMVMVASSVFATILVLNYHHRLASMGPMPYLVQKIFLQWLPWLLRMSRNREKITLKSIRLQNAMKKLSKTEISSRRFSSTILDVEEDFKLRIPGMSPAVKHVQAGLSSNIAPKCEIHDQPNGYANSSPYKTPYDDLIINKEDPYDPDIVSNDSTCGFCGLPDGMFGHNVCTKNNEEIQEELRNIVREIRVITNKIRKEQYCSSIEEDWKFAAMVLDRSCLIAFSIFTVILSAAVFMSPTHVLVY